MAANVKNIPKKYLVAMEVVTRLSNYMNDGDVMFFTDDKEFKKFIRAMKKAGAPLKENR